VARTVICPHCQTKGNLPESAKASRIRCLHCGESFVAAAASAPESESPKVARQKQGQASASGRLTAPNSQGTVVQEVIRPAAGPPAPAASGSWRPVEGARPASGANPVILCALAAMSGIAVLMFGVLVMVFIQDESERELGEPDRGPDLPVVVAPRDYVEPKTSAEPIQKIPSAPEKSTAQLSPEPEPEPVRPTVKDPQEIARALKDATVLLRMKAGGKTISSGTGFVIEVQKDTVWLATNRQVAILDRSDPSSDLVPPGAKPELEAIFRSGQGSKLEQSLPATLIAADFSDDIFTDLAFLQVKGVHEPPAPVNVLGDFEAVEGTRFLEAGFPLEGTLNGTSETRTNPSVTVTGGRVAALRRDEVGRLSLIKIDGSSQSGSRGGPVIDEKSGQLLGVAVAKIGSVDPISIAIPAGELRRAFNGQVGAVDLTLQKSDKSSAELQVKAQVVDPKRNIKGVAVHIVPAVSNPLPSPLPDGSWPPVTKSKEVELAHDVNSDVASGSAKVALKGEGPASRKVLVQTGFKDAKGKYVYGKPREVTLPEKAGRILPPRRLDRVLRLARRTSINLLGPLLENSKECQLIKDEESLTIRIDMPAKLYTLAPELANSRGIPFHNAPITLAEIEGDFAAFVAVGGDIDPGATPPNNPRSKRGEKLPLSVQSQGLILYQDKDNFLRLERAETLSPKMPVVAHRLMIEFVLKGRHAIDPIYRDVPEPFTTLILVKRKGKIRCLYSPDDGTTIVPFEEFDIELPPRVHVGLSASNISTKPFTAVFEDFAILIDEAKIDQAIGE
jgi:hypothetical protein